MKTNILVEYDGGGYSGCIWEWNYFYIDEDGKFEDIMSSGRGGITTLENAKYLLENNGNDFSDKVFVYHLDDKKDMKTFATESNCCNIEGVINWFNKYNSPIAKPFAICSDCKCEMTNVDDLTLVNWRGCGGIMSTADNLVCDECYSFGYCECCNEYVGSGEIVYLDNEGKWNQGSERFENEYKNKAAISMLNDGHSDVCKDCLDYQAGQIERDEQKDLLFQSLATGKPDLFADEMRWFWL